MFRTILSQLRKPVKLTTFASGFASKFPNHISVNGNEISFRQGEIYKNFGANLVLVSAFKFIEVVQFRL